MQIGWGFGCLAPERRYEVKDTRHPARESSAFSRGVISDGIRCDWRHSGKFKYILDGIFVFTRIPACSSNGGPHDRKNRHSETHRKVVAALAAVGIGTDRKTLISRTKLADSGTLTRCLEELEPAVPSTSRW